MNKLVYLCLLVLVAVVSAEELKQGDCDPVAQAEVIRGCDSACGNNTCKLNGKPYCACAEEPKIDTSDEKYECMQLLDDMEEIFPGKAYIGQECRDRCQADKITYYCRQVEGDSLVCVCAPPRSQSQVAVATSEDYMRDADAAGFAGDTGVVFGDFIKEVTKQLSKVMKMLLPMLDNASDDVENTGKVIDNLIHNIKDLLKGMQVKDES